MNNTKSVSQLLLTRFGKIAIPFWRSSEKWKAITLLVTVVTLLLVKIYVAVRLNYLSNEMMNALEKQDGIRFYQDLYLFIFGLAFVTPFEAYYPRMKSELAITWLDWLWSRQLFLLILASDTLKRILGKPKLDNIGQRLTQDAKAFCFTCVGLLIDSLYAAVNVLAFTIVLTGMSPTLTLTAWLYAGFGALIAGTIGKGMSGYINLDSTFDANLRNSVTAALSDLSNLEDLHSPCDKEAAKSKIEESQRLFIDNTKSQIICQKNLDLFRFPFTQLVPLIAAALIAPAYFHHCITFGGLTQACGAFGQIFNGLGLVVIQYQGFSAFFTNINRVGEVVE